MIKNLCQKATKIRQKAKQSKFWKLNIEALLESNNELFEGPISYEDMEACYNDVLDQYDPNVLIKEGELPPEEYEAFEQANDDNPFWSLIDLDEEGNVLDVFLWETDDCEKVGEFLSKKYKWKEQK